MVYLKACPKCGGDMVVDKDTYGRYLDCIQCGLHDDLVVLKTRHAALHTVASNMTADHLYKGVEL